MMKREDRMGSGYYDGDSAGNNAHGGQEKIDKFAMI
jgi:hypothetical protein